MKWGIFYDYQPESYLLKYDKDDRIYYWADLSPELIAELGPMLFNTQEEARAWKRAQGVGGAVLVWNRMSHGRLV